MLAANPPDVPRIKADAELGPLVVTQPTLVFDYWGFDTPAPRAPTAQRNGTSVARSRWPSTRTP